MYGNKLWLFLKGLAWGNLALGAFGFLAGISLTVNTDSTYSTYTEPHPDRWIIAITLFMAGATASALFHFLARVLQTQDTKEILLRDMLQKIESLEKK